MKFLFSSLGKKIQVAFTGILLSLFLVFHLINNLVLFTGADNFNQMVLFLEGIKPLIRIMEFGLLVIILTHVVNAIYLTISNRRSATTRYSVDASATSSLNSRTMIISGSTILLFFIIHLKYIWFTYQAHLFNEGETYYDVLLRNELGYLGHTPTAVFYIIAILFIASHLKHGIQSALKTFGLTNKSKWNIFYFSSVLFWGLIPLGFILVVLSIQVGIIK
tara:strand:- start:1530 stop:2189 length:660 start_codon:yes stop_codon:yes gene_type:complete